MLKIEFDRMEAGFLAGMLRSHSKRAKDEVKKNPDGVVAEFLGDWIKVEESIARKFEKALEADAE